MLEENTLTVQFLKIKQECIIQLYTQPEETRFWTLNNFHNPSMYNYFLLYRL